jgi:putative ABC transport system permease protein
MSAPGDIRYVYIFSAIAVFMLIIASINFMNLSTASASRRAKEVGIRKVLGSGRKALTVQFLTESILLTFFSLVLALTLSFLMLPAFNQLSGKDLNIDFFQ